MSRARRPGAALLCLALALGLALLLERAWSIAFNSLERNGRWAATKTEMERPLLGAQAFYTGSQALAGGVLNLGLWHGYQEVMLREPVDPVVFELDFRLDQGAYLVVLFDELPGQDRSGLRISNDSRFPSAFLTASAAGEFLANAATGLPSTAKRSWHHLRIVFRPPGVEATLDGEAPVRHDLAPRPRQRLGFRSGLRSVAIDNALVRLRDGSTLRESFDRPAGRLRRVLLFAGGAALLCLALLALLARAARPRQAMLALASLELALLLGGLLLQPVAAHRASLFPAPDPGLLARERALRRAEIARITAEIRSRHARRPAPGVRRVLFLGASQTWGVGARAAEEVWVRRLQELFDGDGGPRFECINGGVAGALAPQIAVAYARDWSRLRPWAVVVNLATNNPDPRKLEGALERIARTARERGARTVLLLEPNSIEEPGRRVRPKHAAVRRVAARHGLPVVDMQALMAERYDSGFQWWDFVHLTSFGQRQFAELLHAELLRLGFAAADPPA